MMTFMMPARTAVVASVVLYTPFALALAQDNADSPASEAGPAAAQDRQSTGFWDWIEQNIEIDYPDAHSPDSQRPYSGGGGDGGGDSGGGGGHGG